ncbi:MAG: glycosyltransferase, partial [Verrucomicrobiota bacterium]
MNPAPLLSIVLPCYNEEGNLRALIRSIRESLEPLKITYEIIITDDCSRDNSWTLLKEIASENQRIRAQRFQNNA